MQVEGRRFHIVVKIQCELQKVPDSQTENNFQTGHQMWQKWWDLCITAQDSYFGRYDVKTEVNNLFVIELVGKLINTTSNFPEETCNFFVEICKFTD